MFTLRCRSANLEVQEGPALATLLGVCAVIVAAAAVLAPMGGCAVAAGAAAGAGAGYVAGHAAAENEEDDED